MNGPWLIYKQINWIKWGRRRITRTASLCTAYPRVCHIQTNQVCSHYSQRPLCLRQCSYAYGGALRLWGITLWFRFRRRFLNFIIKCPCTENSNLTTSSVYRLFIGCRWYQYGMIVAKPYNNNRYQQMHCILWRTRKTSAPPKGLSTDSEGLQLEYIWERW